MTTEKTALAEQESFAEPQYMNDAKLLGQDHPDMQTLLSKPIRFMTGNMYGQGDRRNTQDGGWTANEMPLLALLRGAAKGEEIGGVTYSSSTSIPARRWMM